MILDWFATYVPRSLGPTVVVCGLFISSIGLFRNALKQLFIEVNSNLEYAVPALAGLIYVWAVTNLITLPAYLVRHPAGYAVFFALAAKWIERVSAVMIFPQLCYVVNNFREVLRTRSTPSKTTLPQATVRGLILLFLGIMASYAIIGVLLFQQGVPIPGGALLVVIWTLLTFTVSLLGLLWKVSTIELPGYILYGTIFMLSGAEITNFASIGGDIRVFLAGGIGYGLGFLTMLALWLLPDEPLTTESRTNQ